MDNQLELSRPDPCLDPWVFAQRPHTIKAVNIRRVPESVWSQARQHALAAGLPLKHYVISLLAESSSLPTKPRPWTDSSGDAVRTINVRNVPHDTWLLARQNALRSGLTLREFVIALLA